MQQKSNLSSSQSLALVLHLGTSLSFVIAFLPLETLVNLGYILDLHEICIFELHKTIHFNWVEMKLPLKTMVSNIGQA